MRPEEMTGILPGASLTLVTAAISYLASLLHPSFDALVISIIFGMLISNILGNTFALQKGVEASIKVFLPAGIALYGLELSFSPSEIGSLPAVLCVVTATFTLTYFIARGLGMNRELSALLGTGMAVCGASAIAVMSPLVGAKKEETSISVISVMTLGLTGMLLYEMLPSLGPISPSKFSFLIGTTLPMFGQVKVAALTLGKEGLAHAVNIKLMRISTLLIFAIITVFLSKRNSKGANIPWFMLVFFALAVIANVLPEAETIRRFSSPLSKFFLCSALAAIGLSVNFDSITQEGTRPLIAVFLSSGIMVLILYIAVNLLNV